MAKTSEANITAEAHAEAVRAAFERGVNLHHSRIIGAIDYQILNYKSGANGDVADAVIRLKSKLPTPESTISEVHK